MWENRCEVCHQNFVPVKSDAWTDNPHASDQLCQNCHRGGEHSPNQIAAEVVSCAACHRDHRGLNADLSRVADSACTVCHADIADHLAKKSEAKSFDPPLVNVSSFVTDHPDFRSPKRDLARLKFSHFRHMRPGLVDVAPMTLADLDPADRQRYRQPGQTDMDLVKLNCAACHQLDRTPQSTITSAAVGELAALATSAAVRPTGDYMLPVSYEQNCKACHQLSYVGRTNPAATPEPSPAGRGPGEGAGADAARYTAIKPGDVVPHGWGDEKLRRYLEQVLDMKFINESDRTLQSTPLGEALKQPLEKWRLPNRPPKTDEPVQTVGEYLQIELKSALKNLRLQCSECHQMSGQAESLAVQALSTHPLWLENAKFSHVSHRGVTCKSCHAGAFPSESSSVEDAKPSLDTELFLPDRKLCLECHSPPQNSGTTATGGARFDCIECHRYHHGNSPWHGLGDPERGAAQRVTVPEFIQGAPVDSKAIPDK